MKAHLPITKIISRILICGIWSVLFSFQANTQPLDIAGMYTINPSGGDYASGNFKTFTEAVDSLLSRGVGGPVTINVADGTYTERISINQIPGASAANTVTIQSQSLDSTKVVLQFQNTSNTNNWVLRLNGTDYVTIRKMRLYATGTSYARVININGKADNNIIENCQIWGYTTTAWNTYWALIASFSDQAEYNIIRNNYFLNGSQGILMFGIDKDNLSSGTHIYKNTFVDQGFVSIDLEFQNAPIVENNSFHLTNGVPRGIHMEDCYYELAIRNNTINITGGSNAGIDVEWCFGTAGLKGLIKNNFISISGVNALGRGISINGCTHQNIFHNSVSISATDINGSAFYQRDGSSSYPASDIDVRNNIFAHLGGGYAYHVSLTSAIKSPSTNNYYASGDRLANWNGERLDLRSLQDASGGNDANSVSVNPRFYSSTDLHTNTYWLNSIGDTETGITTDIDGESRMSPPDIGADEFTPSTPLSGTYTIGGEGPDYSTIKEAMTDLEATGVIGPTRFEIRDGNYVEYIGKIKKIPGASFSDSIVLTSESGNPKNVIISYATDATDPNIITLDAVDHFTISNLTIKSTGATSGRPLLIQGDRENLNIINNVFSLDHSADWAVVALTDGNTDDVAILDNEFSGGGRCLYFNGDPVDFATNTVIIGNTFSDASAHGIMLKYHISPQIINNTITNGEAVNFTAMHFTQCNKAMVIIRNKINNSDGKNGILLINCLAVGPYRARISSNMLQIGGIQGAYGIRLQTCERQDIFHNSIHITSTDKINGRGVYIQDDNSEINIVNNIIASSGDGFALYVNDPTDITLSDYNGLYSTGDSLASWGGVSYANLSSLKTASDMDGHSVPDEPKFESATDLHTNQLAFEEAGKPLGELYDYDDHPRDPLNPDIGATEFYCETPDFNVFVSATCLGDSTIFIDSSNNITKGAQYSWDYDGDFNPDNISTTPKETVSHYFESSGTHTINFIVSQIGGCSNYLSLPVEVAASPVLDISIDGAYCGNEDGEASVSVTNGSGPYSYFWSTGSINSMVDGLALGTYTVAVSDSFGCTSSSEVIIGEAIEVKVSQLKGSSCGASDGIAKAEATGGIEPYEFVWSNGITSAIDSFLSPGLHSVNVIDANKCSVRGSVVIEHDGSGPQITLKSTIDNKCYGDKMGAIDITITGGNQPYEILWSNGSSGEDVDNLSSGIHDVIIMDANECPAVGSFFVQQPQLITIGSVVEEAGCADNDGRAVALVSGGTEPYKYSWSNGSTKSLQEDLFAGIYSVTVSDGNGCEMNKPIIVNSVGGPVISLSSISGITCSDTTGGSINITTSGGTPLYEWKWSPGGQTAPNISKLSLGAYEIQVTDNAGCTGYNSFEIVKDPPEVDPICLVTVDTATGMNRVIWEKTVTSDVSHYNVYRESSVRDDFQLIASIGVDELSEYVDSVADPFIRSWRYRLSVVDVCGNESRLSKTHKTIHLTMNLGLVTNTVNLIWDEYEGFDVPTYKILRSVADSPVQSVTDLPSSNSRYTDNVSSLQDNLFYFVEVAAPGDGCTSENRKAATLNATRSNRKTKLKSVTGLKSVYEMYNLVVYPNPGNGIFNLDMDLENMADVQLKIFDITGKLINSKVFANQINTLNTEIDLSLQPAGMYHIHIKTDKAFIHRILIKQ